MKEYTTVNVKDCKNEGWLASVGSSNIVAFAPRWEELNSEYQAASGGSYQTGNYLSGKTVTVNQESDASAFAVSVTGGDDSDGYTYKLVLSVGATYWTLDGKAWEGSDVDAVNSGKWSECFYVSNGKKYLIDFSSDGSITALQSFHAYDKRSAKAAGIDVENLTYTNGYAIVVKGGENCMVFNKTDDYYINSNVSVWVYAYSSDGILVGTKQIIK